MSQQEEQSTRKRYSTSSVLLIVLVVGLASGAVAYELASMFAAGQTAQTASQNDYRLYGPGPWGGHPGLFGTRTGSSAFIAQSRVDNVTVTGFNIVNSNQFTMNLAYNGRGTAPAITIVGLAYNLSGSTTLAAGWGTSTTVTVNLVGSGSLTATRHIAALIVPYTA